jgi:ABC-type oligopeptide transport system ATPase subunit
MLAFERVSKVFEKPQRIKALEDVSLTLRRGITIGLVGESGCGKSTLARIGVGLLTPSSGRVLLEGRDIQKMQPRERFLFHRRVQIVFQNPLRALNPLLPIRESLLEGVRLHRLLDDKGEKRWIRELLEWTELDPEILPRFPHELSGGQIQRVVIARVLSLQPDFLIADEPTSALDPSLQSSILRLLENWQKKRGMGLLLITHDFAVVRAMAQEVAVMEKGRIVEYGPTEKIFAEPEHPYTEKLLRDSLLPFGLMVK